MIKSEIVQRLLDEGHITAEEAVVLLQSTQYIPFHTYTPPTTIDPPMWYGDNTNPYT